MMLDAEVYEDEMTLIDDYRNRRGEFADLDREDDGTSAEDKE